MEFTQRISVFLVSLLTFIFSPYSFAEEKTTKPEANKAAEATTPTLSLKEKNLKDSETFLAENKTKSDIITLPSGLQYKVVKEGSGEPPNPSDFVTVNYRGTLIDGTEFDSSYKRGTPSTFAINAIIPGWSEALQLMKPGAKWMLYIPPHLAYGERGAGRLVGPNAMLIFEVELLHAKPAEESEENLSNEGEEG